MADPHYQRASFRHSVAIEGALAALGPTTAEGDDVRLDFGDTFEDLEDVGFELGGIMLVHRYAGYVSSWRSAA